MSYMHISRFSNRQGKNDDLYGTLSSLADAYGGVDGVEAARVFQGDGEYVVMTEFSEFATMDQIRDDSNVRKARQGLAGVQVKTEWLSGRDPSYIFET